MEPDQRNILGGPLQICGARPLTGFYRTGDCSTGEEDAGEHTVCAEVNEAFLVFSKAHGNDLSTPRPELGFAGLQPGDRWCVCAARWMEAFAMGVAPPIVLEATHESFLRHLDLEVVRRYRVPATDGQP
jgi:uncharacterized protein (DUF2237 family)